MFKKYLDALTYRESYIEDSAVINDSNTFPWDREVDVVIAGFGGAGAAAALEAHEQGLTTLVLDRLQGGGATTISGGIFYAGGGTSTQQAAGIEDTPQNMFNYLKQEVQGAVSDDTLKAFCDSSVENHDWLQQHGVPFEASVCPFKTSYPPDHYFFYYSGNESFAPYSDHATPAARGHRGHRKGISGAAIFEPLRDSVVRKGIEVQTQTKVVSLLTDDMRRVIGLKALTLNDGLFAKLTHRLLGKLHRLLRYTALYWPPLFQLFGWLTEALERKFGRVSYIKANKGVMLATGGFYSNQKMIREHAPQFLGGSPLGTLGDDGSGIRMAMQLGAQTALMDSVSAWRFINPPAAFAKGVLVGPSGKRICNEMLYGAQLGERMMRHHNGVGYIILDRQQYRQAFRDLTLKKGLWFHVLQGWFFLKLGYKKAPSIRELAGKLAINPQALQDTLTHYNAIANSDQPDPEGKLKDHMPPLGEGPYYAINTSYHYFFVPCPSLTLGGLKVNEQSGLVLNQQGEDIAGLYAIGRTAVGIPSRGYVSGLSIADCVFSGRRAARHAAGN